MIDATMAMVSFIMPPMVGWAIKMLYVRIKEDVPITLLRSSYGSPKDIKMVFAIKATTIRAEIGPSQESMPTPPIARAKITAAIRLALDLGSRKKNVRFLTVQTIFSAKPELPPQQQIGNADRHRCYCL